MKLKKGKASSHSDTGFHCAVLLMLSVLIFLPITKAGQAARLCTFPGKALNPNYDGVKFVQHILRRMWVVEYFGDSADLVIKQQFGTYFDQHRNKFPFCSKAQRDNLYHKYQNLEKKQELDCDPVNVEIIPFNRDRDFNTVQDARVEFNLVPFEGIAGIELRMDRLLLQRDLGLYGLFYDRPPDKLKGIIECNRKNLSGGKVENYEFLGRSDYYLEKLFSYANLDLMQFMGHCTARIKVAKYFFCRSRNLILSSATQDINDRTYKIIYKVDRGFE